MEKLDQNKLDCDRWETPTGMMKLISTAEEEREKEKQKKPKKANKKS